MAKKKSPWSNARWRRRSRRIRKGADCVNCGTKESLQVHHLQYEKILGFRLPLWVAWPWNLMVLCAKCHSSISKIHHKGIANHRRATVMVMGNKYHRWNAWMRFKWIALPIILAVMVLALALI